MSTYTYDTTTTVGKIRTLIFDTDIGNSGANAYFSDEEINVFHGLTSGNLLLSAAMALRAMGASVPAIMYQAGDVTIDKRKISDARMRLAESYEKTAYSTPAEYVDSVIYNINKFGNDLSEYINDPDIF